MSIPPDSVTIHPYFKAHPGKLEAFKANFPKFVELTAAEPGCRYYGFTTNGDEIHCREAYVDAEALLAHIQSVGALIGECLQISDLTRVEIHGPADELEKLKGPLADLNPTWWVFETGVGW